MPSTTINYNQHKLMPVHICWRSQLLLMTFLIIPPVPQPLTASHPAPVNTARMLPNNSIKHFRKIGRQWQRWTSKTQTSSCTVADIIMPLVLLSWYLPCLCTVSLKAWALACSRQSPVSPACLVQSCATRRWLALVSGFSSCVPASHFDVFSSHRSFARWLCHSAFLLDL